MSDNEAVAAPPQPPSYASANSSEVAHGDDPAVVTRRIHLYEALLEEYGTHCPPDRPARAASDTPVRPCDFSERIKDVRQPRVEEFLLALKTDASEEPHSVVAEETSEPKGVKDREERDARHVSEFFTLLARRQREEADKVFGQDNTGLREKYRRLLKDVWDKVPHVKNLSDPAESSDPIDKCVEWAMAHEIYGVIDDHRERHRKSAANAEDKDAERSKDDLDRLALLSWLTNLAASSASHGKPAPPAEPAIAAAPMPAADKAAAEAATAEAAAQPTPQAAAESVAESIPVAPAEQQATQDLDALAQGILQFILRAVRAQNAMQASTDAVAQSMEAVTSEVTEAASREEATEATPQTDDETPTESQT